MAEAEDTTLQRVMRLFRLSDNDVAGARLPILDPGTVGRLRRGDSQPVMTTANDLLDRLNLVVAARFGADPGITLDHLWRGVEPDWSALTALSRADSEGAAA